MSRNKVSPGVRLKAPSPEQVRRRNLIIGLFIAAVVVLVATIAVGMNREENQAANDQTPAGSVSPKTDPSVSKPATAGNGETSQPAASSNPAGARSTTAIQQPASPQADKSAHRVTIDTARGQIVMEVYPDLMPITVANFEKLVKMGFYDGLKFHRVEDWVVQGGDPKGDGAGGPGWTIRLETNPQLKNVRGAVAMARSRDPDSAGSQFYILKKDASWLDGDYAVFGRVIQGMDVVDQIQKGDLMKTVQGE